MSPEQNFVQDSLLPACSIACLLAAVHLSLFKQIQQSLASSKPSKATGLRWTWRPAEYDGQQAPHSQAVHAALNGQVEQRSWLSYYDAYAPCLTTTISQVLNSV